MMNGEREWVGKEEDMSYGYRGRVLRINLSNKEINIERPSPIFYRRYFGGRNIAAYYLLRELKPGIDPLGSDNKLVFTTSIITGVPLPGASRYTVAAKSPLTGGYGEAEAGGWWGPELKFAGYDTVIVEGKSKRPVYLWIHNGEIEIKDAAHLWGKVTKEVEDILHKELKDDRARVLQMGPAGERLVRFANLVNELVHFNGRTGLGAVMGSKNLKAIVVRGQERVKIKDSDTIIKLARWFTRRLKEHPGISVLHDLGTPKNVLPLSRSGLLPSRNFHDGTIDQVERISGEEMKRTLRSGSEGCFACPVRCKKSVKVDGPYRVDPDYGGPEYETIGALGSGCGITDAKVIAKANEICNKYAMDTISCGLTIAFAMECFENGIITKEDTGGIELKFGNGEAVIKFAKMIALREGLGDILAEGSARAARKFGRGAERFAMQVKGQELPSHEPRGKWAVGIGYAVSPTGADHLQAAHDVCFEESEDYMGQVAPLGVLETIPSKDLGPGKIRLFVYLQSIWSLYNVLDLCIFVGVPEYSMFTISNLVEIVRATTGWDTSAFELIKAGERGITMARSFNVREGFTRKDDRLPERLFQPLEAGALKGARIPKEEFERALTLYYQMMGWSSHAGIPTRSKLEELDVGWVADLMENA